VNPERTTVTALFKSTDYNLKITALLENHLAQETGGHPFPQKVLHFLRSQLYTSPEIYREGIPVRATVRSIWVLNTRLIITSAWETRMKHHVRHIQWQGNLSSGINIGSPI
jgi:hypothetical protein